MKKLQQGFLLAILLALPLSSLFAQQPVEDAVRKSIGYWKVLQDNISFNAVTTKAASGSTLINGTATAFGHSVSLEGTAKNNRLQQLAYVFPDNIQLDLQHMRSLMGKEVKQMVPQELGAALKMKRLEVDFAGTHISAIRVVMSAGTWAILKDKNVDVLGVTTSFAVLDPTSAVKSVAADITGTLSLPKDITDYFKIGETALTVTGAVNTKTQQFSLAVDLSSEQIPIGAKQSTLFFRNAFIEVYSGVTSNGITIGGQVEVRPTGQSPILLNGELAFDIPKSIFGQGWMTGYWRNPFGISPDLYITHLGMGFGVDFSKPPYPLPIVGFEGGLSVGDPDPKKARFSGKATLGLHAGDPSKNMIDAADINANLYDLVNTFYRNGVPKHLAKLLKQMELRNARLTIVPPGEGVDLFGNHYEPGILIQGIFRAPNNHSGTLLFAINEQGIEAYGGLSPIKMQGFELTSADGREGPEAYILANVSNPSAAMFGLDGRVNVLGIQSDANIYYSDAGFNITVNGKVLNAFEAKLDVAGTDLFKGGSIYVNASMRDDLFNRINDVAADRIGEVAKAENAKLEKAKSDLKIYEPQFNTAKAKYLKIKGEVQEEYRQMCSKFTNLEQQKKEQNDKITKINGEIKSIDSQISQLNKKIDDGFRPARFIKNITKCTSGFYDPRNGGECWSCPSSYNRTVFAVNSSKACEKAAYEAFSKATYRGKAKGEVVLGVESPIKTKCPSGQFFDPIDGGTCWTIPSGYKRTGYSVKSDRAASKLVPANFKPASKLASLACPSPAFVDPRNGGECWTCPSGYVRPVTTVPVTGQKACERADMPSLKAQVVKLEAEKVTKIADRDIFTKALGNITQAITEELKTACKTAASSDLINADPRVAPYWTKYTELDIRVNGFRDIIEAYRQLVAGTFKAAEWVARNGGNPAGVVKIKSASFSSCLNLAVGGNVALKVSGTYAGQPLNASFDVNLKSPDQMIKRFADMLLATNTARSTRNTGQCTRPNVPKPNLEGSRIAQLKADAKNMKGIHQVRAEKDKKPAWVGPDRFKDGNFNDKLLIALKKGAVNDMQALAAYGINLNIRDANQATPLLWAAYKGDVSKVSYLVSKGADPKLKGAIKLSSGTVGSLIGIAAMKGDLNMLQYLVEGLSLPIDDREYNLATKRANGKTALTWAALKGHDDCVKYLIEMGAKPASSPEAVVLAVSNQHKVLALYLLNQGFPVNARDPKGNTALHIACETGNSALVKGLIEKGADVNAKTKDGRTALIIAAMKGNTELCKMLIAANANRDVKYQKRTADKWAKKQGFKELAKYIKKPF